MRNYLEFESGIKGLEEQLDKLKDPFNKGGLAEVDTKKNHRLKRWCINIALAEFLPRLQFDLKSALFDFLGYNSNKVKFCRKIS